jgi:hypothetical protein
MSEQLVYYTVMMPKVSNVYSKEIKENTDAEGIARFIICTTYSGNVHRSIWLYDIYSLNSSHLNSFSSSCFVMNMRRLLSCCIMS